MPRLDSAVALADIDRVLNYKSKFLPYAEGVAETLVLYKECLRRWAPPNSRYLDPPPPGAIADKLGAPHYHGVLFALRTDIEAGALATWEERVHGAVLSDLLSAAQDLLEDSYLLAAAVCAGASLEEHIRKLCEKHAIDTVKNEKPVKTSNLNDQLGKAGAYSAAHKDQIGGWLRIRNEAAHGKPEFEQRTPPEIQLMIDGTRNVIAQFPA